MMQQSHFQLNYSLGLVYPLEVKSRINAYRSKDLKVQRPFFIGRVHRDIRNIIQEANFFYFTIFRTLCFVEVGFIIFILIISLLHYAAVLVHTIDFPLDFLTQFLKQFDLSQNFKAQQSQIVKSAINTTFNVKVGQDENLRQQDLIETIETGVDQTMNYPMQLMNKLQNFIISKSTPKRQTSSNQVNNSFQQQRFSQMSPKKILKNQNSMLNLNKQSSKGSCIDSNQQMNLDNSGQDNNKDQNLIAINIVGANKSSYFKQIQDGSQKSISFPKRYKSNSKTLRMITSKSKIEDGSSAINDIEQGKGVSFLSVHQNLLTHNPNYNNNQEISIDKLNESQAYNQIFKKIELKDLDCMFMEMQIIKEAFLQLEKVIILAQQDSCKGNIESSIINFCIVKSIFMKVKNLAQVSNCNYNLGLLYIRKRDFQKAGDTFETSIYNHLQSEGNGITSIQEYIQKLKCGDIKIMQEDIDQIVLLAKKIKAFVVSLRFQGIQPNFPKKDQTNMLLQGIKYSDLCIEMLQTAFHSNTHPSLLTSYITSASIYLDLGMIEQAAQYMINADIIWQIYFEKSKENENIHLSSNVSSYKNIQFQNHQISTTDFSLHKKQAISFNLNTDKNSNPSRYQMYKYSILPVEIVRSLKLMNQGRIYLELNLHQQGCQFLTEAIETGEIFDPSIRMEALMQLNKCLLLQNIDNSYIIEEIKKYSGDPLNIYIVLSCPVSPQNINYINFQIQIIQKLYHAFIKYSDRISILQYHEDLISINQLAQIQSETHLSNFLQKIQSNFISLCAEYQVQTQPTMHWTLALRQVLLKINYGQNLNKQIQFQNQLLEMLKDQQDYILQDPYSNQDYESENQNQQQEFLSQHSKIHTPINRSNINQQSLNITNQKDVKKNSDKKNIIPDIKLMQSPYKNARDLVIMISQESQTSIQNQQIKHVDPFYGFTQNQLPTVIHLKKTSLNSQNEVNNIHLQSDQDLNYEIISQISNPFTTTDKAVANKKYYQYIDFNQFFKEILSQRIYLKEEK